jgi:hypothetical protein
MGCSHPRWAWLHEIMIPGAKTMCLLCGDILSAPTTTGKASQSHPSPAGQRNDHNKPTREITAERQREPSGPKLQADSPNGPVRDREHPGPS